MELFPVYKENSIHDDINADTTEVGALFLLGKDRRILIRARDMSKNKAPASVRNSSFLKVSWTVPLHTQKVTILHVFFYFPSVNEIS